jgi:hypothetical protein
VEHALRSNLHTGADEFARAVVSSLEEAGLASASGAARQNVIDDVFAEVRRAWREVRASRYPGDDLTQADGRTPRLSWESLVDYVTLDSTYHAVPILDRGRRMRELVASADTVRDAKGASEGDAATTDGRLWMQSGTVVKVLGSDNWVGFDEPKVTHTSASNWARLKAPPVETPTVSEGKDEEKDQQPPRQAESKCGDSRRSWRDFGSYK